MITDETVRRRSTRKRGIVDEADADDEACSPMTSTTTTTTTVTAIAQKEKGERETFGATAVQQQMVNNYIGCETTQSVPASPTGAMATSTTSTTTASNPPPTSASATANIETATTAAKDIPPSTQPPTDSSSPNNINIRTPPVANVQTPLLVPPVEPIAEASLPPTSSSSSSSQSFHHLDKKFSPELNYMLVEFRKLELQLLGAPPPTNSSYSQQRQVKNEAAGSKERREKLHGFILHLEDTMRQIAEGCAMEKQQLQKHQLDGNNDYDKEEQVRAAQRLEEHILTNLLPVKVRLTRQLAAQRGASRNPATAPVRPGGGEGGSVGGVSSVIISGDRVGDAGVVEGSSCITTMPTAAKEGTFAAAAEAKRKAHERMVLLQAERRRLLEKSGEGAGGGPSSFLSSLSFSAGVDIGGVASTATAVTSKQGVVPSYYGMPIGQAGGSFLTSRLHGRVLGGGGAGTAAGAAIVGGAAAGKVVPTSLPRAAAPAMPSNMARTTALADPSSAAKAAAPPGRDTPTLSTPAAKRRMVLYAGMAPGSTQVSSSINAVAGVHPGFIDEQTAKMVTLVDEERIRVERLEKCAARVALGMNGKASNNRDIANDVCEIVGMKVLGSGSNRSPEGVVDGGGDSTQQMIDFEEHSTSIGLRQLPQTKMSVAQHHYQHMAESGDDASSVVRSKPKPTRPHIPLNFNDPSLDQSQRFEVRLQEARWRQRKRRRDRRRKRSGIRTGTPDNGNGYKILPGNFSQQLRQAPAVLPPQHFLGNANGERKHGDSHTANSAGRIPYSLGPSTPGLGGGGGKGGGGGGDNSMKSGSSNSRPIEYICAICNEHYSFNCDMNPWWALSNHECPKCGKTQIPRLDIAAQANAIEYHPALLAHLDEGNTKTERGDSGVVESSSYPPLDTSLSANTPANTSTTTSMAMGLHVIPYQPNAVATGTQGGMSYVTRPINPALAVGIARDTSSYSDSDVSHTDESDGEGGSGIVNGGFNYDESSDDEEATPFATRGDNNMDGDDDSVAREESVEREEFGYEYKGEKMSDDQARRLLVLIEHASTCPGR